jgi:hypothetical protein
MSTSSESSDESAASGPGAPLSSSQEGLDSDTLESVIDKAGRIDVSEDHVIDFKSMYEAYVIDYDSSGRVDIEKMFPDLFTHVKKPETIEDLREMENKFEDMEDSTLKTDFLTLLTVAIQIHQLRECYEQIDNMQKKFKFTSEDLASKVRIQKLDKILDYLKNAFDNYGCEKFESKHLLYGITGDSADNELLKDLKQLSVDISSSKKENKTTKRENALPRIVPMYARLINQFLALLQSMGVFVFHSACVDRKEINDLIKDLSNKQIMNCFPARREATDSDWLVYVWQYQEEVAKIGITSQEYDHIMLHNMCRENLRLPMDVSDYTNHLKIGGTVSRIRQVARRLNNPTRVKVLMLYGPYETKSIAEEIEDKLLNSKLVEQISNEVMKTNHYSGVKFDGHSEFVKYCDNLVEICNSIIG